MIGMTTLFVVGTGTADDNQVYEALRGIPVDELLICHDTKTEAQRKRVEYQAEQLGVPLHSIQTLYDRIAAGRLPNRILILIRPAEAKDYVISLMRKLRKPRHYLRHNVEHDIKIMICQPPGVATLEDSVLADALELIAYEDICQIPIWLYAPRRFAHGIQTLLAGQARDIAPLKQINSSISSGIYGTDGKAELFTELLWHHTDILCSVAEAAKHSGIPVSLTAEQSGNMISILCTFSDGLICSLSASTHDKGNFGFREELRLTGNNFGSAFGGVTIELDSSLEGFVKYIKILETDGYRVGVKLDASQKTEDSLKDLKNLKLSPFDDTPAATVDMQEDTQKDLIHSRRLLLDFIKTKPVPCAPTLKSCLPGIWMLDATLRSLVEKRSIQCAEINFNSPEDRDEFKRHIDEIRATLSDPSSHRMLGIRLAQAGLFEAAIRTVTHGISQTDNQLQALSLSRYDVTLEPDLNILEFFRGIVSSRDCQSLSNPHEDILDVLNLRKPTQ